MPDPIFVVPYDPEWPRLFSALGRKLRAALGDAALRIDHIGSTSVPGLDAKPVIDIQISVAAFEPEEAFAVPLENLGYVFRRSNPDLTKRYFREAPGTRRLHLHVRRAGSWAEQFALLYRDYMRAHPDELAPYAAVKYGLAEQYGEDRQGYTNAKGPALWEIMKRADAWNQQVGWTPGASDA